MECSICMDLIRDITSAATPCGHVFHEMCILHWFSISEGICPQCRTNTSEEDLIKLYVSAASRKNADEKGKKKLAEELKRAKRRISELEIEQEKMISKQRKLEEEISVAEVRIECLRETCDDLMSQKRNLCNAAGPSRGLPDFSDFFPDLSPIMIVPGVNTREHKRRGMEDMFFKKNGKTTFESLLADSDSDDDIFENVPSVNTREHKRKNLSDLFFKKKGKTTFESPLADSDPFDDIFEDLWDKECSPIYNANIVSSNRATTKDLSALPRLLEGIEAEMLEYF